MSHRKITASRVSRVPVAGFEPLEDRRLFSVTTDAQGWTVVAPAVDSRIIYVSSAAGSDQNTGLSSGAPVASLARAYGLVRSGSPDQVLLRRGDTWNTPFPRWQKSGRSASEPMLIGTYGSGQRPQIVTGAVSSAFEVTGSTPVSYLSLQGMEFRSGVRDPSSSGFNPAAVGQQYSGLRWYAASEGFAVEDCSFRYYSDNIDVEGTDAPVKNVLIRRVVSTDSYNTKMNSQGMYGYNINGLTVEQSVFDHNGWSERVAGAGQTGHNHNLYFSYSVLNATFRQNVIANGSNNGLLSRGGGDIENNLFVNNPSAISYGGAPGSMSTPGGVRGSIVGNVIVGTRSLGSISYGYGINIANTAPGSPTLISGNIFTGDTQHAKPAIMFEVDWNTKNPSAAVGINDVIVEKNIFNHWFRAIQTDGSMVNNGTGVGAFNRVSIRDNDFQFSSGTLVKQGQAYSAAAETWSGNRYFDSTAGGNWFSMNGQSMNATQWIAQIDKTGKVQQVSYPDPNRTAATYNEALGDGGSTGEFLSAARLQSSDHWDANYLAAKVNDYMRGGFSATLVTPVSPTPVVPTPVVPAPVVPTPVGPTPVVTPVVPTPVVPSPVGPTPVVTPVVPTPVVPSPVGPSPVVGAGPVGPSPAAQPMNVVGTSGNDRVALLALRGGRMLLIDNGVRSVHLLADVPQVRISTGDGNDLIYVGPGLAGCVIDAGAGNDRIVGGSGSDTISAGAGNDLVVTGGGRNVVGGGSGRDRIIGGINSDLLSGDAGDDLIAGGLGDDVLIGGGGADVMAGLGGSDLLIAGWASTDDTTALASVLDAWATGQSYNAHVTHLAPDAGSAVALAGVTFADDAVRDRIFGGLGMDWFLAEDDVMIGTSPLEVVTPL